MNNLDHEINQAIDKVVHLFKNAYLAASGFPCYDVNGKTGEHLSNRNLLCEFDDYAPFFWFLGEEQYIYRQFEKIEKQLKKRRLFFKRPQIRRDKGLGLPGPIRWLPYADSQDYVEILYGLLELFALSEKRAFLSAAENLMDVILDHFSVNGHIRSFRLMPFGPTFSVSDAMAGMHMEILVELAETIKDKRKAGQYVNTAREMLNQWIMTDMFKEFGVFPSVFLEYPLSKVPGLSKKALIAELAKPNASMGYALLAMSSSSFEIPEARKAFSRWIKGLQEYFSTSNCVLAHTPRLQVFEKHGPVLSTNFAILDILCDAVHIFDDEECRDLAITITDFFLRFQSPATGLVPDQPGCNRSYIDANTDFSVSLVKMTEITSRNEYRQAGERIINGILKYHSGPFGYYRDVNLDTGEPLENLVETRFCSLLLKALILYRDNLRVYGEGGHWSMFRDR